MFKVFIHSTSFTLLLKVRNRIARGNGLRNVCPSVSSAVCDQTEILVEVEKLNFRQMVLKLKVQVLFLVCLHH